MIFKTDYNKPHYILDGVCCLITTAVPAPLADLSARSPANSKHDHIEF